jgi:hypothetical protein
VKQGRRHWLAWARSVAFTLALTALVAGGIGDAGGLMPAAMLATGTLGLGFLYLLFPRGLHFAFGTATGLVLYATLFEVLGHAQFPGAPPWARLVAFLLPVLAFLGAVWLRRVELARIAEGAGGAGLADLPHAARWLVWSGVIGLFCFALPLNRLAPPWQATALLVAMSAIGVIVAVAVRDVVRLLVDVSLITAELAGRARPLAVPLATFLLIYALLVIGFAAAYRVADGLSVAPLFHGPEGAMRLTYSDALHVSVATLSTVGYGDIRPYDDGIRVLASLQVVAGQVLLLFGFAEIMRTRRLREPDAPLDRGRGTGHSPAAPPRHPGAD